MTHVSSTQTVPETDAIPRHVAIIMDGNGRWAKKRHLPRAAGHKKGVDSVRSMVRACIERDIEYLTVFAFSSENWRRPAEEVSYLMRLFRSMLEREVDNLHKDGIRLKLIGDFSRFESRVVELIQAGEALTKENRRLTLTVAVDYGGRWDIMRAVNALARQHPEKAGQFDEGDLAPHLAMAYAPEPDLFIRTGGEQRLSNFLLWQLAYTELYFTEKLWPEFDARALDEAIASYRGRERRFGRTSEQLSADVSAPAAPLIAQNA